MDGKLVIIDVVDGMVVSVIKSDPDIKVEIHDYDVMDETNCRRDDSGQPYNLETY